MKKLILLIIYVFIAVAFIGCNDKELSSDRTYYLSFKLNGSTTMLVAENTLFTDPGVSATYANGLVYPSYSTVTPYYFGSMATSVITSQPNKYVITYGINDPAYIPQLWLTRNVFVANTGNLVNSIEGLYTSTVQSVVGNASNLEYVIIEKNDTLANAYNLSDAYGGLYDIGQGMGPTAASQGSIIKAINISKNQFAFTNPANVLIDSVKVNAASKTINLYTTDTIPTPHVLYSITLTQVSL
jgi:hypothetical protein